MNIITFTDVAQSYDRALQEVVGNFFTAGGHKTIAQTDVNFLQANIAFGFKRLDNVDQTPTIIFLGCSTSNWERFKVNDPHHTRAFAYERRCKIERKTFIRIKLGTDDNLAERQAKQLWGQLDGVLSSRVADLSKRGIFQTQIDPSPQYLKDQYSIVYWGYMYAELRCTYTNDVASIA